MLPLKPGMVFFLYIGVLPVEELFKDHKITDLLKVKYIQLLEKFEVALSFSPSQVTMYDISI